MSNRGTTTLQLNPYEIGLGLRGRIRSGLGEDYGLEVRQAAVARRQQERVSRAYDEADARRAEQERQRILELTQKTYDKAAKAQANILVAGQNQFRRLMSVGGIFAAFVVGTVALSSVFSKPNSSRKSRSKTRRRSRKSRRSTSVAATTAPAPWSPA